ncbi:MAG: hypothetical protein WCO23_03735 [bacterium]
MAKVLIIEIEQLYGTNDTNRGNQMMAVAGEALAGYIRNEAPGKHEVYNTQQKKITAQEIREYRPDYQGEDVNIDDEAICEMALQLAMDATKSDESLVIGMRCVTPFFEHGMRLSAKIKSLIYQADLHQSNGEKIAPKIVVGGYHPSGMVGKAELPDQDNIGKNIYQGNKFKKIEKKLRAEMGDPSAEVIDAYAIGEGEETFLELINHWEEGKALDEVQGLVYRDEAQRVHFTGRREPMHAEGDRRLLDLPSPNRYLTLPLLEDGKLLKLPSSVGCTQVGSFPGDEDIRGEIGANLSRGCYNKCEFCSSQFIQSECDSKGKLNPRMRFRDPKMVIREIAQYYKDPNFKTNFIYFFDLTFNAFYKKHANELCQAMKDARVVPADNEKGFEVVFDANVANGERIFGGDDIEKVHWFCLSEVFDISKTPLEEVDKALGLMADAGCTKIGYGIEGFTPYDIMHIKRLEKNNTDEAQIEAEGIDRFAQTAWVLRKTIEKGIFTRGYFMWGTENQDEKSFEKAKALLSMEIPVMIFDNMELLKQVVKFVFETQKEGIAKPDIWKFCRNELHLSEEQIHDKSRMLEIDHLRIAYETPYPSTDVARERELRYFQYYRDEEGFFLHDEKGKLIPMLYNEEQPLALVLENGQRQYFLHGEEVHPDDLQACEKRVEKEWYGKTLEFAIDNGWDDYELLTQEIPILNSDISIEDMERHQGEFIQDFYSSQSYSDSMERRAELQPHCAEGIYAWQKFWNDRQNRNFDFLSETQKEYVENILKNRLDSMNLSEGDVDEWMDKRFIKGRKPSPKENLDSGQVEENGLLIQNMDMDFSGGMGTK